MIRLLVVRCLRVAYICLAISVLSGVTTAVLAWSLYNATCITNVQLTGGAYQGIFPEESYLESAGSKRPANGAKSR